eukprot:3677074-Amphidinium_carterae.1
MPDRTAEVLIVLRKLTPLTHLQSKPELLGCVATVTTQTVPSTDKNLLRANFCAHHTEQVEHLNDFARIATWVLPGLTKSSRPVSYTHLRAHETEADR